MDLVGKIDLFGYENIFLSLFHSDKEAPEPIRGIMRGADNTPTKSMVEGIIGTSI